MSDARSTDQDFLTKDSFLDYSPESRTDYRGLAQSFTARDYQRLQYLAKSAEFDGWLKIRHIPRSEAIGDLPRFKVMVWRADDDGGGYRPIAGQLFQHEAEELRRQWALAKDQQGFAQRVVGAISRIVEGGVA